MRKLLLKINKRYNQIMNCYISVAANNSIFNQLIFSFRSVTRKKTPLKMRIAKHNIFLRPGTTDLSVATISLRGEFKELEGVFDKQSRGLIIDAGGYIGTAALELSRMYPNATLVTIEPSSSNYKVLKMNIAGNSNIYAENAALLPEIPKEKVVLKDTKTGEWGFTIVECPETSSIETVNVVSLDYLLKKYGFDDIMILKMDIEGGEYQFFMKPEWLNKTKVFLVELHDQFVQGCSEKFQEANIGRYVYKSNGEKFISIGKNFFE